MKKSVWAKKFWLKKVVNFVNFFVTTKFLKYQYLSHFFEWTNTKSCYFNKNINPEKWQNLSLFLQKCVRVHIFIVMPMLVSEILVQCKQWHCLKHWFDINIVFTISANVWFLSAHPTMKRPKSITPSACILLHWLSPFSCFP